VSREVIPAGATVTYRIVTSKEAENKNSEGSSVVEAVSIAFGDHTYPINAEISGHAVPAQEPWRDRG
jgi:hypothetical protein